VLAPGGILALGGLLSTTRTQGPVRWLRRARVAAIIRRALGVGGLTVVDIVHDVGVMPVTEVAIVLARRPGGGP
jgi:hypothetical protein